MALCNITGTVYLSNGDPAASRTVVFVNLDGRVAPGYGGAVVPESAYARTDRNGYIDTTLVDGNYKVSIGDHEGSARVPDAPTASFSSILTVDPIPVEVPDWYLAFDARISDAQDDAGEALIAASDAESAADNAVAVAGAAQADAATALTTANDAQTTADNAQADADSAQSAADNAQTAADNAQVDATAAGTAAASAQTTASQALSDAAASKAPPYVTFADRAQAQGTAVPEDIAFIDVGRLRYKRDDTGTALQTDDGQMWSPAGDPSPQHWGAVEGSTLDQSAAVQAAVSWARATWNQALWSFDLTVDFLGATFYCDQSIDATGIRQPRLKIKNGQIVSRAAGKIALDCAMTRAVVLQDFVVYGDDTTPPAWGIYMGRALINGGYAGTDGTAFVGVSGAWGSFTRGALLQFAAEVSKWSGRTYFYNRIKSETAVAVACVADMGTIVRQFGSSTTSDYQTLPDVASGNHSNICHDWGQVDIRRVAAFNLTITAISKAAQAVISVAAGTLADAGIQVGDRVFISDGQMTEISYQPLTVTAVGTDQITVNFNSTAATTYVSGGTLQNVTGPGLLTSGVRTLSIEGGYILTYGSPCIKIDGEGPPPYDWRLHLQFERHADKPVTVSLPTGTMVFPQLHLQATNTQQSPKTSVVWVDGTGQLTLSGGSLRISNMATPPAQSVLAPQAQIARDGFDIDVPLQAALPSPSLLVRSSGRDFASDRTPRTILQVGQLLLQSSVLALNSIGMRWSGGGLKVYRPEAGAERNVQIQDSANNGQLNVATDRVNTTDKWSGKMVWNISVNRPVYATGTGATATWVFADGTTANTPV